MLPVKPYGYPRGRGDPKSERPRARKVRARAAGRRAATESMDGAIHPAEMRLIEADAADRFLSRLFEKYAPVSQKRRLP